MLMKSCIVVWLLFLIACNNTSFKKTGFEGSLLPAFNIKLMDTSKEINTKDIKSKDPFVMFFINPNCPYCKAQTNEITKNIKDLSNIKFYIISSFPYPLIHQYYMENQLQKYSNIIVGNDYNGMFQTYYGVSGVPYMAFYNTDNKLTNVLVGKADYNKIIKAAFP